LLCDRSTKRFAQDDGLVWELAIAGWIRRKHERSKKSQALGMTKERATLP
jgi:hypothetical protein